MREVLEHVVHGSIALPVLGAVRSDVGGLTMGVGVRSASSLGAAAAEQTGCQAGEERSKGRHRTGHDGEVDLDGGPDVGDIVASRLLAQVEETVHVDQTNDGNNRNAVQWD